MKEGALLRLSKVDLKGKRGQQKEEELSLFEIALMETVDKLF